MDKKIISSFIVGAIAIGGAGGFFAGMKYAQAKSPVSQRGFVAGLQNLSPQERQQRLAQGGIGRGGRGAGGGAASGEIISKDSQSLTIKLPDGGSKIVLFSSSTAVGTMSAGSASDLQTGKDVFVTGTANSDGSISAQNIQIRPSAAN